MKKNILIALSVLSIIALLGYILLILFPAGAENIDEKKEISMTQNCEEYIDFTKGLSKKEQENLFQKLKKTKNVDDLLPYICSQNIAWRAYIAENIHTPEKVLDMYSDDSSYIVRQYLSANRKLPNHLAQKLQSDEERVLLALARNPVVSPEVLERIAEENFSPMIQESLAYNRGTTEEFQKKMAEKITSINALKHLKNNPNLFDSVQEILEKREDKKEAGEEIKN